MTYKEIVKAIVARESVNWLENQLTANGVQFLFTEAGETTETQKEKNGGFFFKTTVRVWTGSIVDPVVDVSAYIDDNGVMPLYLTRAGSFAAIWFGNNELNERCGIEKLAL